MKINAGFLCFHPETVFMAINFLDRFMEKSNLRWRQRIYQVALGCVYIAGKFNEETREPMVNAAVYCYPKLLPQILTFHQDMRHGGVRKIRYFCRKN